jgi:hypothetical protein
MLFVFPEQESQVNPVLADQVEPATDAGPRGPVGTDGHPGHGYAANARTVHYEFGLGQIGQREHPVLEACQAHESVAAALAGQPGIETGLKIDVLVDRPGLAHHWHGGGIWAEVVGQQAGQRRRLIGSGPLQAQTQDPASSSADIC